MHKTISYISPSGRSYRLRYCRVRRWRNGRISPIQWLRDGLWYHWEVFLNSSVRVESGFEQLFLPRRALRCRLVSVAAHYEKGW